MTGAAGRPARPSVRVRVPGKVNVTLAVGERRPDGYHDLSTVFMAVDLHDTVLVRPAERMSVTVRGRGEGRVPLDEDNLAVRAARLIAKETGRERAAEIRIDKSIPVAGGMAGGSADAAATLVACNELWGLGLSYEELRLLAAQLGSDVAFPLLGGVGLGTGRGECLTQLPEAGAGAFHWVFAVAEDGLSTPEVFREHDRLQELREVPPPAGEQERAATVAAVVRALRGGDARALARIAERGNDLQPAALSLRPELRRTLRLGRQAGALAALLSGSGPTCAFLAESAGAAAGLARVLSASGSCREALATTGPVPGCLSAG
ncbi:4-(cytidine 5'-diphospho)-2-C-methyl-D-erythritol kinase [Kitasatospora sp. SUK 42]|uniref:4-(cytidine 5'-diphospho)-2-C-methyl-D-erythritol kinase n=1 Tax=Kitasatospora sp. SUK 42 TaxID=1588882 RepID=UPI001C3197E3|nr:4-(cytidine 5'-diphospho)-2-C-methyl-D-erythritol kinase [Kitasatospora sp. SUK 42]MBV2156813.1 4-(cytidine 5'-diphospho)-2-C-methyl-D-erythritol kinase [Kitasatospora sp. SUK 42]